MKVLVPSLAPVPRVVESVAHFTARYPQAEITIAIPEVERWKLTGTACEQCLIWTLGERWLPLDRVRVREEIAGQGFDLILLPVGMPRQSLLFVAHWVRSVGRDCFRFCAGGLFSVLSRIRSWRGVWLLLVLYSLVCWSPVSLFLRLSRTADGAILLAVNAGARLLRGTGPGTRTASPSPAPVCHVINSLGTGGAQRQLVEYLRRCAQGCDPPHLLVLFEYNDLFLQQLSAVGLPCEILYRSLRRNRLAHLCGRAFPHATVLFLLWRRLRQLRPRCVYSWLFVANVISAPAARLAGVGFVCSSVRNLSAWKTWPAQRAWWFRAADRLSAPLNDVIVANSHAVAADYAAWSGVDPARLGVIANGIDVDRLLAAPHTEVRTHLGISEQQTMLLTVGRLAEEKNQAMLIRCCHALTARGHDIVLVIVGHGEQEQELRELCQHLGAGEVRFAGKTEEPQSYYRAADLFVLSSRIEGMPNAVMEAQAFGLPVVTTACGGAGEVVADSVTGFVVGLDDEPAMIEAIGRLLREEDLRRDMGRRATARMRTELNLERMVNAIDGITGRVS